MAAPQARRTNRVVVLGSLNMDLTVRTEKLPVPGETVLGRDFRTSPGGKGANQAVAAARLGAEVSMVGCVGPDDYGRRLTEDVAADGVDVDQVRIVDSPTGVALIVVDERGQNQIALAQGANALVDPETVEFAADLIGTAHVVVAQLETPLESIVAAAEAARDAGVPFILNAAPARADLQELLPLVTVLVVNETELEIVLGSRAEPGEEAAAALELLERGPRAIVVTLGSRGSLVVDAAQSIAVPTHPVKVEDSTAAGDAFVGALAARFAGLDRLEEAARFASAAGALACTKPGAQPSLPTEAEVLSLLERGEGTRAEPRNTRKTRKGPEQDSQDVATDGQDDSSVDLPHRSSTRSASVSLRRPPSWFTGSSVPSLLPLPHSAPPREPLSWNQNGGV